MGEAPSQNSDRLRQKLVRTVLERLVKGEDRESLLSQLQERLNHEQADNVLKEAIDLYEGLKNSGKLDDFEYDVHFASKRTSVGWKDIIGLGITG